MNNFTKIMKIKKFHILFLISITISAEAIVRGFGLVDFPLYDVDPVLGYVPKASQSGSFLNKNSWQFNSLHMSSLEFIPTKNRNILLVGDSVVLGGNSYRQEDRLGPQLNKIGLGEIWPISAGSWALLNQLAWLKKNPEVVNIVDDIVFVLNSDDFSEASSWRCELTHPTSKPPIALVYLFKKYIYSFGECDKPLSEWLKVMPGDVELEFKLFALNHTDKIIVFLYPDLAEMNNEELRSLRVIEQVEFFSNSGVFNVFDISADPLWSTQYYRDGIHPTSQGNQVLSKIIARKLNERVLTRQ